MPTLRIEGELSVYRAAELKQTLLEQLETSTRLELDLSAVDDIDTAGLQLLLLARREARQREGGLRIVAQSAAVDDMLALLQLDAALDNVPRSPSAQGG